MANIARLRQALDFIEAHQSLWEQAWWAERLVHEADIYLLLEDPANPACGTAGCIAGWGCFLNGWLPVFGSQTSPVDVFASEVRFHGEGDAVAIEDKAQELFELDDEWANALFDSSNTLEDLRDMIGAIEEGVDPHIYVRRSDA